MIKANILDTINESVLEGTETPSNLSDTFAERFSEQERSPSPTGSDDSSDTIKPSDTDILKDKIYEVYHSSRKPK